MTGRHLVAGWPRQLHLKLCQFVKLVKLPRSSRQQFRRGTPARATHQAPARASAAAVGATPSTLRPALPPRAPSVAPIRSRAPRSARIRHRRAGWSEGRRSGRAASRGDAAADGERSRRLTQGTTTPSPSLRGVMVLVARRGCNVTECI